MIYRYHKINIKHYSFCGACGICETKNLTRARYFRYAYTIFTFIKTSNVLPENCTVVL